VNLNLGKGIISIMTEPTQKPLNSGLTINSSREEEVLLFLVDDDGSHHEQTQAVLLLHVVKQQYAPDLVFVVAVAVHQSRGSQQELFVYPLNGLLGCSVGLSLLIRA
jgi:hypothetical protein